MISYVAIIQFWPCLSLLGYLWSWAVMNDNNSKVRKHYRITEWAYIWTFVWGAEAHQTKVQIRLTLNYVNLQWRSGAEPWAGSIGRQPHQGQSPLKLLGRLMKQPNWPKNSAWHFKMCKNHFVQKSYYTLSSIVVKSYLLACRPLSWPFIHFLLPCPTNLTRSSSFKSI